MPADHADIQHNSGQVMGDALAIALLEARGFSAGAHFPSGGTLGRRLLLRSVT